MKELKINLSIKNPNKMDQNEFKELIHEQNLTVATLKSLNRAVADELDERFSESPDERKISLSNDLKSNLDKISTFNVAIASLMLTKAQFRYEGALLLGDNVEFSIHLNFLATLRDEVQAEIKDQLNILFST